MTTKCERVHGHVFSTVLSDNINSPWSGAMVKKARAWDTNTASHFLASHEARRNMGGLQIKNIAVPAEQLEEDVPAVAHPRKL